MVVFPSNKAICERLNGMPCSTMRRHLARLVAAGLLIRRDSPNGKRYMRRHGDERMAFGFDLSPLHARAEEIARAAETVRDTERRTQRLRVIVSLMRRDLAAVAEYGAELRPELDLWEELRETAALVARLLRRKLSLEDLSAHRAELGRLLDRARDIIDGPDAEKMNTSDAHSEHHHQNSEKDLIESEPVHDQGITAREGADAATETPVTDAGEDDTPPAPKIPLHLVIASCPSLGTFYRTEIRHWHQLFDAACHVRPAMGISPSAWDEAQRVMGAEAASIVVVAMLERFAEIRSPGAYLRALTTKAAAGAFSCGPMVMALMSRRHAA